MTTISNTELTANINFKGAELSSLKSKKNKLEYLWQGDPTFWARHSPILFPVVGRLLDDRYVFQEQTYFMSQHGFARDLEFEQTSKGPDHASFALKADMNTRMVFPFKFVLNISYKLDGIKLIINYEVENNDRETMYFSLGAHPAFNCPLQKDEKRSDYAIVLDQKETAAIQRLENGIRTGIDELYLKNQDTIPLTDQLFEHDALVFHGLKSTQASLCKGTTPVLTIQFTGFPWLGIWSKNHESPFVCIEPWHGVADHMNHNKHLEKKDAIIALPKNECWKTELVIEIHH